MDLLDPRATPECAFQSVYWCMANDDTPALQRHLELHFTNSKLSCMVDQWTSLLLQTLQKGKVDALKLILPFADDSVLCQETCKNGKSLLNKLLFEGMERRDLQVVTDTLARGADPNLNHHGKPLLHIAVTAGQLDMAAALIQGGAKLTTLDRRGDGILHSVLKSQEDEKLPAVKWLLARGVSVRLPSSSGKLPIHIAAGNPSSDSPHVIDALIADGQDVNVRDNVNSDTPLHIACGLCNQETIFRLIQLGAKFNIENRHGQTPLAKLLKFTQGVPDFHSKTRVALAKKLIQIGFRIPTAVCKTEIKRSNRQNKIGRDKISDRYVSLMASIRNVASLQSLSRCALRESLVSGSGVDKQIDELEIPKNLQKYILFRDADQELQCI